MTPQSTFERSAYSEADPLSIFSAAGPTWSVPVAADPIHSPLCFSINLGMDLIITMGLKTKIFYDVELRASRGLLWSSKAK